MSGAQFFEGLSVPSRPDVHNLEPLLQAVANDHPQAVEALLTKLRPYLGWLVRSRVGPQDDGILDASGLVQKALLRISQNISQLRERNVPHLLAWVKVIVRNLILDARRANRHELENIRLVESVDPPALNPMSEEEKLRASRALAAAEAMSRLPKRRRQVLEMSFIEQLSDAEIAKRLGGSAGAVRVLRFRALQDLRRLLEADPDSDCRPACRHPQAEGRNP
jgi:RNA polymerase sigma factor (sigma-70 family)